MACGSCQREFLILKEQFGDKIRIEVEGVEIFKDGIEFDKYIKK